MKCNNAVYHMMCVMRCGHISPSVTAWELYFKHEAFRLCPDGRFGCTWVGVGFAVKIFGIGRFCVRNREGGIYVSPSSHRGESEGAMSTHAPCQPVRSYLREDAQR